ncbi:hypothetical protein BHECKSOX_292 [Bathymodiolus heckerae thiotrophic gill symbiont]|nr:hypothetical protein BHECKSOX_292 [Bathymodiolus heckerae thiotrophic gill symbiont]
MQVLCEDDNPMQAQRYDPVKGRLVIDYKMITRVANDMDAKRITELEYWRYKRALNEGHETEKLYKRITAFHKQLGGDKSASDILMKRLEKLAEEKEKK